MELPHVGLIAARKNVIGVRFKHHLIADTRVNIYFYNLFFQTVLHKSLKQRRGVPNFVLTKGNILNLT